MLPSQAFPRMVRYQNGILLLSFTWHSTPLPRGPPCLMSIIVFVMKLSMLSAFRQVNKCPLQYIDIGLGYINTVQLHVQFPCVHEIIPKSTFKYFCSHGIITFSFACISLNICDNGIPASRANFWISVLVYGSAKTRIHSYGQSLALII